MGYSYSDRGRLACDACGAADGNTRKRTCPHRIQYAEGGSLPYCSAPALCAACYAKRKGTLHDGCKAGAAKRNQDEIARGARFAAGELEVRTAYGDWHAAVPDGFVGVTFKARGAEAHRLIPKAVYDPGRKSWLSDYGPDVHPWAGPDGKAATE